MSQFNFFELFLLIIYKFFGISTKLTREKNILDKNFLNGVHVKRKRGFFVIKNKNLNIYIRKFSSDYKVYNEIFLHNCYDVCKKYLQNIEKPLIMDIGSNSGISCMYFKKINLNSMFICVEPNKKNNIVLNLNLQENKVGYKLLNKGLWHKDATMYLKETEEFWTSKIQVNESEYIVDCLNLRSLITKYVNQKVDLLKIDIEGSEIDIFKNDLTITDSLKKINAIIIEVHDKSNMYLISDILEDNEFRNTVCSDIIFGVKRNI